MPEVKLELQGRIDAIRGLLASVTVRALCSVLCSDRRRQSIRQDGRPNRPCPLHNLWRNFAPKGTMCARKRILSSTGHISKKKETNSAVLVLERTIPTERQPLVGESSIVLTRMSGPRSRSTISQNIW
jgi:hypothetical protein